MIHVFYFQPTLTRASLVAGKPVKEFWIAATSTDSLLGSTDKYIIRLGIDTSDPKNYMLVPYWSYTPPITDSLTLGGIRFLKKGSAINRVQATKLVERNNDLAHFLGVKPKTVTYYSFANTEEYANYMGFLFHPIIYILGPGGKCFAPFAVVSAGNTENYFHEVVHLYQSEIIGNGGYSRLALEGFQPGPAALLL